jgi:F-type H+-transporting ATPase subunit gamma
MSSLVLREHLRLFDELRQIVTAMRNLAYAELQRLERAIAAQSRAQVCILQALADVSGNESNDAAKTRIRLIIGTERGFCGGFNEHLAELMQKFARQDEDAIWIVAGSRLADRTKDVIANSITVPGSSTTEECPSIVDGWLGALLDRAGSLLVPDAIDLRVMHHDALQTSETQLLPHPPLPRSTRGPRPLQTLPNKNLLPWLTTDCLRICLLGACYASLVQENRWHLLQMQRAQDHLDEAAARMRRRYFLARQTDITTELETLMSSLNALGGDGRGR